MNKTHGLSSHPSYQSWHSMLRRCFDPSHKDFPYYGGRGITCADAWKDVALFIQDMGEKPIGTSLDRIDNTKGYYKENCRWATPTIQARNQGDYRTNTSGCKGVSWQSKGQRWLVLRMKERKRRVLYWGPDFFEACCVSRSWENRECK